jgi:branched-chain amino acid transport system ATP-binding protein
MSKDPKRLKHKGFAMKNGVLLRIDGISKRFGGLNAVSQVSFNIRQGEIVSLIGPNGAGKTTLFNLISGVHRADTGAIFFAGKNIVGLRPFEICQQGIGRTFQLMQSFPHMTVVENVMTSSLFGRIPKVSIGESRELSEKLCEMVGIGEKKQSFPKSLTVADQKRIEIARGLAVNPKLLLLDEVMSGLNPSETNEAIKLVRKLRDSGITIFLIEHVMKVVMGISDRVIVLHHGEKIAEGSTVEVANNRQVIEAYLGEKIEA